MYLLLGEMTLIKNKAKAQPNDPVIYERAMNDMRIFTLDSSPCECASQARPYGTIYYDTNNKPCVVPNSWNEEDAAIACMIVL